MCKISLKYMELNGRGNDLKIASFSSFLKSVTFLKFKAHFLQGVMGTDLNFVLKLHIFAE